MPIPGALHWRREAGTDHPGSTAGLGIHRDLPPLAVALTAGSGAGAPAEQPVRSRLLLPEKLLISMGFRFRRSTRFGPLRFNAEGAAPAIVCARIHRRRAAVGAGPGEPPAQPRLPGNENSWPAGVDRNAAPSAVSRRSSWPCGCSRPGEPAPQVPERGWS